MKQKTFAIYAKRIQELVKWDESLNFDLYLEMFLLKISTSSCIFCSSALEDIMEFCAKRDLRVYISIDCGEICVNVCKK